LAQTEWTPTQWQQKLVAMAAEVELALSLKLNDGRARTMMSSTLM
jgi:hypothetical protein